MFNAGDRVQMREEHTTENRILKHGGIPHGCVTRVRDDGIVFVHFDGCKRVSHCPPEWLRYEVDT